MTIDTLFSKTVDDKKTGLKVQFSAKHILDVRVSQDI
jgi:hypothetical protein